MHTEHSVGRRLVLRVHGVVRPLGLVSARAIRAPARVDIAKTGPPSAWAQARLPCRRGVSDTLIEALRFIYWGVV